jgi:hypothetical protein
VPGFLTASFPQPEGTILPTPYTLLTPGQCFTYSLNPGGEFLRGNINGTTFLYTGGLITGVYGPLTISTAVPLTEIMVGLLSNAGGETRPLTSLVVDKRETLDICAILG